MHQQFNIVFLPVAEAPLDGNVDLVGGEVAHVDHGRQTDVGTGHALAKALQPLHQVACGEIRADVDVDAIAVGRVCNPANAFTELIEARLDEMRQDDRMFCGFDDPCLPLEQGHMQGIFQQLDLLADRLWRDEKLVGRTAKCALTHDRPECAQRIERGKPRVLSSQVTLRR